MRNCLAYSWSSYSSSRSNSKKATSFTSHQRGRRLVQAHTVAGDKGGGGVEAVGGIVQDKRETRLVVENEEEQEVESIIPPLVPRCAVSSLRAFVRANDLSFSHFITLIMTHNFSVISVAANKFWSLRKRFATFLFPNIERVTNLINYKIINHRMFYTPQPMQPCNPFQSSSRVTSDQYTMTGPI